MSKNESEIGTTANKEAMQAKDKQNIEHPYLFHLIQAKLWQAAVDENALYFPPTYSQDGFTHATANPKLLLNVANHFYTDVPVIGCVCK